ncbi:MAG: hypothetical protein H7X86_13990 [Gorillibacterium sp.]|nr:hypothetical protein [Gorillibacterium sp.]
MKEAFWKRVEGMRVKEKRCSLWKVRKVSGRKIMKGFFKYRAPNNTRQENVGAGILLGSELTVYKLARVVNLPVTKTVLTRIQRESGILSIAYPGRIFTWKAAGKRIHSNIPDKIIHPERLLKALVFDIWILNIDRHGGNCVLYPKGGKYDFYLIDHGLTLAGAINFRKTRWNSAYWERVSRYNRQFLKGVRNNIKSYKQLQPYVREIQQISEKRIRDIVESTPSDYYSSKTKQQVIRLLIYRQRKMEPIIKNWLKDIGINA